MSLIPPEEIKVLRWESSVGPAGVGIYRVDERGCPGTALMQVEMTAFEMVELAHDLLATVRDRDPGLAYSAVATRPIDLTPEDKKTIREMLAGITDETKAPRND